MGPVQAIKTGFAKPDQVKFLASRGAAKGALSGRARNQRGKVACIALLAALPLGSNADTLQPLDQFIVTRIPNGVDLSPRDTSSSTQELVYSTRQISRNQLVEFAKSICQNESPEIEILQPSWMQWAAGKTPARITC